jgi:hypothetical protein
MRASPASNCSLFDIHRLKKNYKEKIPGQEISWSRTPPAIDFYPILFDLFPLIIQKAGFKEEALIQKLRDLKFIGDSPGAPPGSGPSGGGFAREPARWLLAWSPPPAGPAINTETPPTGAGGVKTHLLIKMSPKDGW